MPREGTRGGKEASGAGLGVNPRARWPSAGSPSFPGAGPDPPAAGGAHHARLVATGPDWEVAGPRQGSSPQPSLGSTCSALSPRPVTGGGAAHFHPHGPQPWVMAGCLPLLVLGPATAQGAFRGTWGRGVFFGLKVAEDAALAACHRTEWSRKAGLGGVLSLQRARSPQGRGGAAMSCVCLTRCRDPPGAHPAQGSLHAASEVPMFYHRSAQRSSPATRALHGEAPPAGPPRLPAAWERVGLGWRAVRASWPPGCTRQGRPFLNGGDATAPASGGTSSTLKA